MIVRELITRLGFNADNAELRRYEGSLRNAEIFAKGLVVAMAAFSSFRAFQRIADETQSLEARIAQLPQTIGESGAAFEDVAKHATNARQELSAYASFYIKAGNATQDYIKDQGELLRLADAVSFGLAAGGATATEQSQAFFQLGQAIGSPTVQMEEMNTLIDVAPDLFRELGKEIDGANGNLKAFISTGKVTGKMLAEGLLKTLDKFEKKSKQIPLTVGQASVLIGNRLAVIVQKFNRKSMAITRVANAMVSVFDGIANGILWLGESIDSFVQKTTGWQSALRLLTIALAMAFAPAAWAGMISMVKALSMALQVLFWRIVANPVVLAIAAILAIIALVIEDLWAWYDGQDSVTGEVIKLWKKFTDWLEKQFNDMLETLSDWDKWVDSGADAIVKLLKPMEDKIKEFEQWAKDTFMGIVPDWMQSGFSMVGNLVSGGASATPEQSILQTLPAGGAGQINEFKSNINISVPTGTSEQQQQFIKQYTDQAIRESFMNVVSGASANFVVAE